MQLERFPFARSCFGLGALALIVAAFGCAGGDTDPGGDGGGGGGTPQGPTPLGAVAGLGIGDVAVYQAVKRPLVVAGVAAQSNIPIVSERDALVRVWVNLAAPPPTPLTGRLYLGDAPFVEVTAPIAATSTEPDLASTLNFEVPGALLKGDVQWRVEVGTLPPSGTVPEGAPTPYPAAGTELMPTSSAGQTLKIVVVPIQYNGDGSGRLPDTSEAQIALYKAGFEAMYPAPHTEITVHAPVPYSGQVDPFGSGWDSLLMNIAQLRQQDGAAPDVYYFGAFAPANSFGQFCNGGCVAGLGMTSQSAGDSFARACIGLGFTGNDAVDTALHEIGHNHGRLHAPCQTGDADPGYPYPDGSDGVWGYDKSRKLLLPPQTPDIMGYCMPTWISDYTYDALYERIRAVNAMPGAKVIGSLPKKSYERAMVDAQGNVTRMPDLELGDAPEGEARAVAFTGTHKSWTGAAHYYRWDHLPGGVLLWERQADSYEAVAIELEGATKVLPR